MENKEQPYVVGDQGTEKKDYKKAIQFAITGMHFNWFMDNRLLLNLYGRNFWYMEVNRATQVIAGREVALQCLLYSKRMGG